MASVPRLMREVNRRDLFVSLRARALEAHGLGVDEAKNKAWATWGAHRDRYLAKSYDELVELASSGR